MIPTLKRIHTVFAVQKSFKPLKYIILLFVLFIYFPRLFTTCRYTGSSLKDVELSVVLQISYCDLQFQGEKSGV